MYMLPHEMEYKVTGIINMNNNTKLLIQAELDLIALKYDLEVIVVKDKVYNPNAEGNNE